MPPPAPSLPRSLKARRNGFALAGFCEPVRPARREGSGGLCQDEPDDD